jgi:beta-barrel assembly-enhancing protease
MYSKILLIGILLFLSCDAVRPIFISDEEEIELGNKLKAEILADTATYPRYTANQEVIDYINTMGNNLVKAQSDRDIPFTFTIINDTIINAFAIPGGHVFIYKGLLKSATSGAEVAGVLAHEIGHITMNHGTDRLLQANAIGLVNDIVFGSDESVAAAIAQMLEGLVFLKFSRNDEYEADSCAVAYTTASIYNPRGMVSFFEKLKNMSGGTGVWEPLSTHPETQNRIDAVNGIITRNPNAPAATEELYQQEYAAIKSKL